MDAREGQWADFALSTPEKDGRFSYTCGWCGDVLLHDMWQRKKAFQDMVGDHFYDHREVSALSGSADTEGGDR